MGTEFITDQSTTFIGGQDASKTPHLVPENAYFTGVNVSVENGILKPRYGIQKHQSALTFPSGGIERRNGTTISHKDIFQSGKFQAITSYSIASQYFIVVVISGQIYFVDEQTLSVQHVPLEGEQINPAAARINFSPAGKYLVLFDFPAYPVIIEGTTARRADPLKLEIPVSNIGAYNQNRLLVGNAGNEFTAGDPVGASFAPDAPISFIEFLTISSPFYGQVFQLNTNYNNDPITALTFLQVADTSTGIGPFLAATKEAIYSYNTQVPRDQWEAGQFGTIFVYNAGIAGPRAVENVNSDVFFISADGQVRTLAMSREEQGKWSKTPISKEVRNWIKINDKNLVQYSFITYFQNKIFVSVNPYRTTALGLNGESLPDYAFGGLAVLELDNISTLGKDSSPAWAGLWTGMRPMGMVKCNDRCFVMSKDAGINALYEMRPDLTYDTDGRNIRYIKSKIETREYDFGDSMFNNKQLASIDLKVKRTRGDFEVKVRYKPDHSERYLDWRSFKHKSPWRICKAPFNFLGYAAQSFINVNLGTPSNASRSCNPVTKIMNQTFRHVQLELTFEAIYWELEGLRIKASIDKQNENIDSCPTYKTVAVPEECVREWSYGDFETCQQKQT